MADHEISYRQLVTTFTDFLVVAIHTILYERSVYPPTTFLTARKYNFVVHQHRHPKVCEWINDAVAATETKILEGSIDKICLVIFDSSTKPVERFIFDLSRFPIEPMSDHLPIVDIEEHFRATISKFCNCMATLKPLPTGCSFSLVLDLKPNGEPPIGHAQPWIAAEAAAEEETDCFVTVPVRSVNGGRMIFEIWIEENQTVNNHLQESAQQLRGVENEQHSV